MNCIHCSTPLEPNARFCRHCGLTAEASLAAEDKTVSLRPRPQAANPQQPQASSTEAPWIPTQSVAHEPAQNYQPAVGATIPTVNPPARRRSTRFGCLLTFVVLLIIVAAGWFFVLQPYLHNLATTQLDKALSSAVGAIPLEAAQQLPSGASITVRENTLNGLFASSIASSGIIQQPNFRIAPEGVRLDFQLYGSPCAVTAAPQITNNGLVVTNVTVSGIIGLFLSTDDVTTLLNTHIAQALQRTHHTISTIQLKDHEIDLIVS